MLLWLAEYLTQFHTGFAVVQYLSLRAIFAVITALTVALFLGPKVIRKLREYQIGQSIRDDGPKSHLSKAGTPTMGGALILLSITVSTLLWGNLENKYVWLTLLVTLAFGVIGWVDDYRKVVEKNSRGLPARWKYFWQSALAIVAGIYMFATAPSSAEISLIIPFFKDVIIELGIFYIVLSYFVIVGASNAVNLTDGLDGLAILPTVMVGAALGLCAYFAGNVNYSDYLSIPYVMGAGELVVFSGALVGAGVGFLWFNTYPAALGMMAVITRQEIVFFIMGGIFVAETMSVILQVGSFKLTGKRIFRMAPLHHHYELKGWPEPRVIVRFWIVTLLLVLAGLATLKIR